jgi:CDP-diacylglycerol--serine O-phosphatidyltransferase
VKKPRIGGAVYILPNLLTTGNLFWGFFAIMKALNHEFAWAGSAILLAAVFDVLDGRVARLTKGTSEFGVQYDSLCDLLSFGAAPAIIMYQYGLHMFGRIGWILCFLFMACGALRLARFNVQSSIGKASGDFTGLPIPMAAAVIATYVLFMNDLASNFASETGWVGDFYNAHLSGQQARANFLVAAAPALSLAMVSNIVYRSHKALKIRGIKPFKLLAALVFAIALVAYQPEMVGFAACFLYALSGPFEWAIGWKKPTEDDEIFAAEQDDSLMEGPEPHGDAETSPGGASAPATMRDEGKREMRRIGALTRDPSNSGGTT